jgi:hypothetical protein
MSIWIQKAGGINSKMMRQAAKNAGVSWNYNSVKYKKKGIGFVDADITDADLIQSELRKLLGFSPRVIDEPTITDRSQIK